MSPIFLYVDFVLFFSTIFVGKTSLNFSGFPLGQIECVLFFFTSLAYYLYLIHRENLKFQDRPLKCVLNKLDSSSLIKPPVLHASFLLDGFSQQVNETSLRGLLLFDLVSLVSF